MSIFYGIAGLAAIFTFFAAKTSYWILKFLAGAAWVVSGLYWQANPPGILTAGDSIHVIVYLLLYIFGISCMFWTFWRTNGESMGKIIPFWRSEEDDESYRHESTRRERNDEYAKRLNRALNNRR